MSEYVRNIRQFIGTELLLLPSVSVLVHDDRGDLLLVRHADSGLWGLVGGAVEVDEGPAQAAVRETEEETGLAVELTRLVSTMGGPEFRVTYPNGDRTAYVATVYEARIIGGVERPDGDEIVELGWFGRDDLASVELTSIARSVLADVHSMPQGGDLAR